MKPQALPGKPRETGGQRGRETERQNCCTASPAQVNIANLLVGIFGTLTHFLWNGPKHDPKTPGGRSHRDKKREGEEASVILRLIDAWLAGWLDD